MSPSDTTRFRRMCGQFRWLAIVMVVGVGGLLICLHPVFPVLNWMVHGRPVLVGNALRFLLWTAPSACYLFGVWTIGSAMGQLEKGRLIQPTLSRALRRVGLALGVGGLTSVFLVTNILRLIEGGRGGILHFDVAGMTLGMIGGALFLLGRVIDQAGRVQAELDEMI